MERIPERTAEHIVQVPVPQTLEEVAEVVKAVKNPLRSVFLARLVNRSTTTLFPSINPGDQVRRDPQACGVATTGPSASNCGEDVGSLARCRSSTES